MCAGLSGGTIQVFGKENVPMDQWLTQRPALRLLDRAGAGPADGVLASSGEEALAALSRGVAPEQVFLLPLKILIF